MARRRPENHLWSLDPMDESSVPNARITLALMICIRRLPGAFSERDFDDLGAVLVPVLQHHERATRVALEAYRRSRMAKGEEDSSLPEADSRRILHDRSVQTLLGEAFVRSSVHFRALFDKAQQSLESFVDQHSFAADRNVEMLARLIQLPPAEMALLRLATAFCYGSINRSLFAFVDSPSRIVNAIEVLCGVRGAASLQMLNGSSVLARSFLLEALNTGPARCDLDDLLRLSAVGECLLGTPFADEGSMAGAVLKPMPPPTGSAGLEWPHLEEPHALMRSALKAAIEAGASGVNFLLYGAPGTGKTEFVRQLITETGASGFMVDEVGEDGTEASRSERLASLQLGQTFAGKQARAVLVLDEAEDIFQSDYRLPMARMYRASNESKAWINAMLEKNPHPVIWISNRVSQLDPAYLRRFSYCFEFPQTPQAVRHRIARDRLGSVGCSEDVIEAMSAIPEVSPAHLEAGARFAALTAASSLGADVAVRSLIASQLKAGGHTIPTRPVDPSTRFDMRYLSVRGHATPDRVLQSLERLGGAATLLFAGPPGTGKTQLAGVMAKRLGRKLVVRTASDINSKWYGESEGNVARMFRDCDPATELLFLDEAEILLAERDSGGHRADRAVTAEFLRWLEMFQGVFICATNHADTFDAALARRFTFRLEFEPLRLEQRLELYAELALGWQPENGQVGQTIPVGAEVRSCLARLDRLTPGDFANAARRVRALELPTDAWLTELAAEQNAKRGVRSQRIGFL